MESMIDELAWSAGRDPVEFRAGLLSTLPPFARAAARGGESGLGTVATEGRARESRSTILRQHRRPGGRGLGRSRQEHPGAQSDLRGGLWHGDQPAGHRGAGPGGIAYGLSAVLHSELTLKDGRVEQTNFHDYRVLRMPDMPQIEVHVIESDAKMGGIGEPATAPISAAVANAVYALTRQRLRSLPLRLA